MRHLWLPMHFVLFLSLLFVTGYGTAEASESKPSPISSDPPVAKNTKSTPKENNEGSKQPNQTIQQPTPGSTQPLTQKKIDERGNVPGEITHERQQDRMWPPSAAWAAVLVAGVSAFATIVYVVVSFGQWLAIRRQANISESALRISERAWLAVAFDRPFFFARGTQGPIEFSVTNIGKTVGRLKTKAIKGKLWDSDCIPVRPMEAKPIGPIPTIATLFPGQSLVLEGLVGIPFTDDQIDAIQRGDTRFDVYGYVVYDDVFDQRHMTRFCQVYDPTVGNEGLGGFTYPRDAQADYNDAD